ncbi:LGFP repeat-containing protein [Kineococcus sp. R86509]|uniref:LGFP repeat-containing protein n=1 Tax=Kineococcus sp. R86509 TaxID=3093851 RepID=UPI0036D39CD8
MQTTTPRTAVTAALAAVVVAAAAFGCGTGTAHATTYPGPQGPRDVHGAIEQEWLHLRADPGAFQPGPPLTDELRTPIKTGAFNHFERASIYWSPTTGAHEVHGDFRTWWASLGWENSYLGFPLTGELPAVGGVCQRFQGGQAYWSAETGAHAVHGDFFSYYASQGWERSWLGYPLTEEYPVTEEGGLSGEVAQDFQGGTLLWSPSTGVIAPPLRVDLSVSSEVRAGEAVVSQFTVTNTGRETISGAVLDAVALASGEGDLRGFDDYPPECDYAGLSHRYCQLGVLGAGQQRTFRMVTSTTAADAGLVLSVLGSVEERGDDEHTFLSNHVNRGVALH